MIGEREAGQLHVPRYTKGCWGHPGHRLCWLCKVRYVVTLGRLFFRGARR